MTDLHPKQIYNDSEADRSIEVKFSNEDVVLVQELDSGQYHVYPTPLFESGMERSLTNNRFELKNGVQ